MAIFEAHKCVNLSGPKIDFPGKNRISGPKIDFPGKNRISGPKIDFPSKNRTETNTKQ
jgi:hypothetical protein